MRRTSRTVALSLLVVGLLSARAHALVITTALGNGADTFINGDGATYRRGENNYGGGSTMTCRRSSGDYTRKGYVRFDVGGIHASDPTLKVTVSSVSSQGGSPTTMNVWALNDGYPGVDNSSPTNGSVNDDEDTHDEFWPERVIDWFSAPGNLGNTTMDPASTTLLGTFTVPLGAPKYTTLSFNDPALTALVNNDTNGVITLAMQPAATSAYVYLYTKEGTSTTAYRPQLVVQTAALTWDGEGGANKNWSHAPNWDADGLPTDSATFNNTATAAAGTVTNIVDEDFTVGTLTYEHTGAGASDYHTTQINSGQTLRAYGSSGGNAMVVGTTATDGVTTRVAFVGEGTLNIDNPSADFLMTGYHHAGGVSRSTLAVDMSGLATFHATVDDFLAPGGFINANSQLTLAQTSSITADGVAFAAWGGAAGGTNFVHLGQTNTLHTNKLVISGGRASSTTEFTPGLPGTPTVEIRGKAGGSSRADLWVADQNGNGGYGRGGSNRATGVADFTAGSIDALLDVAIIGRNGAVASRRPGAATGTLSFDEGTIDANSIILARTPALPNTNLVDYKTANQGHTYGTLNMGGGTLLAGSMAIAEVQGHGTPVNASGRDLSTRATGTLNISGGSATVTGDVTLAHHTSDGTATATGIIDMTGGSLTILGDLYEGAGGATSVSTVTVSGGTLSVGDAGIGSIAVDTVNLGSPGGTLSLCGLNPAEGNHAIDDYNHGAGGTLDLRVNAFGTGTIVATTADFAAGSLVSVSPVTAAPGGSTADQSAWVGSTGTWDATHSPWSNGNPAGFAIPTSSTFQFMQAGTLTDSGVASTPPPTWTGT